MQRVSADMIVTRAEDGIWEPVELGQGAEVKVLGTIPATGETVLLERYPPGCEIPAHHHPHHLHLYVLVGSAEGPDGDIISAGDYFFLPPGLPHGPFRVREPFHVLAISGGPYRIDHE